VTAKEPATFEEYAALFAPDVQARLRSVREAIRAAAPPEATETISYRMPAFHLGGVLVWYGAHANHIGFYPRASGVAAFAKELSDFPHAKGSVQFPFNRPLPLDLIARIVRFRVAEQRG
jgi:uncharacterized protein YdhG (YjbR/CyaY superfamily)